MKATGKVFSPCVVIPVYNHHRAIGRVVATLAKRHLPIILVDDGSAGECTRVLVELNETHPALVTCLHHPTNRGKGAAVMTGMRCAWSMGHTHAIQIDADGQHDAGDVDRFLDAARKNPDAVINGCPVYDGSVPKARLIGRYATHVWTWINTLSLAIADSMCGFRLYPLHRVMALCETTPIGQRMTFDTDIIVRLYWAGAKIVNLKTRVTYPDDGVSHFRPFKDNIDISLMHAGHFFGMLCRIPRLIGYWRRHG